MSLRALIILSLPMLAVAGCAGTARIDQLEARLREQEDQLARLETELDRNRNELQVARQEAHTLRTQLSERGEKTLLPEQANVLFRATGIRFHSLLTGGHDADERPGDEMLNVVVFPHDADGELLKLPGTVRLEALDLTLPAEQQRIGTWEFSIDEARELWHQGFIGSGYQFRLPWQTTPQSSEVLLHARLTTPDGRQFDASEIIHIDPPAGFSPEMIADPEPVDSSSPGGPPRLLPVSDPREE